MKRGTLLVATHAENAPHTLTNRIFGFLWHRRRQSQWNASFVFQIGHCWHLRAGTHIGCVFRFWVCYFSPLFFLHSWFFVCWFACRSFSVLWFLYCSRSFLLHCQCTTMGAGVLAWAESVCTTAVYSHILVWTLSCNLSAAFFMFDRRLKVILHGTNISFISRNNMNDEQKPTTNQFCFAVHREPRFAGQLGTSTACVSIAARTRAVFVCMCVSLCWIDDKCIENIH